VSIYQISFSIYQLGSPHLLTQMDWTVTGLSYDLADVDILFGLDLLREIVLTVDGPGGQFRLDFLSGHPRQITGPPVVADRRPSVFRLPPRPAGPARRRPRPGYARPAPPSPGRSRAAPRPPPGCRRAAPPGRNS